ncbi:molybdopterin molybdotransferase MoeA [Colwellia sp. BRX10-3]|uniref:molybdopterin molybdotransferase MoeA n=1 Tax=Colwellia sp. BRX10-3 TaxID=2759844 RepID=UPI0015F5C401|nr:molybdopterin molybdotransferase MoeA [Colwellia sp. BRX10-3]MBA6390190.1 molybdopterin molybdotransferase MoeA [Colwellia sp. BRX10-3]
MVDCCSSPGLMPFEKALETMLAAITPITDIERITLTDSLGRVLSTDITSPINVPPHNNSAMDGYAFAQSSLANQTQLKLAGRSMAGQPYQGICGKGECIRIMTGAKIPDGCDTVEMQENCQVAGESVKFLVPRQLGDHVRYAGEDIGENQVVFTKGRRLSAIDIGVLASLGIQELTVFRKLNVALIATGDELKALGEPLGSGDIFESNSYALAAMLKNLNVNVINFGVIIDDETAIRQAFIQADKQADAVISSGGVSVGDADYTKLVLEQIGEIAFWKIAMKPGKPFAFGKLSNSVFFGLPGNPVSAMVTADLLAMPALMKLQNCHPAPPITLKAKTLTDLRKSPGRMDFQRGVLSYNNNGELIVESTGSQGSGILTSIASANCYIVLPAEQGRVPAFETVNIRLFERFFA